MAVKTFDPKSVELIFAGIPVEGYADGTFITVARNNPSFNAITGSDGEGARSLSNDRSGTVEITLLQTSASNALLSAAVNVDEVSGDGVGPLMIKDNSGTTLVAAETAWLQQPSNREFAREISNTVWTIETDQLNIFHGGN